MRVWTAVPFFLRRPSAEGFPPKEISHFVSSALRLEIARLAVRATVDVSSFLFAAPPDDTSYVRPASHDGAGPHEAIPAGSDPGRLGAASVDEQKVDTDDKHPQGEYQHRPQTETDTDQEQRSRGVG